VKNKPSESTLIYCNKQSLLTSAT